MPTLTKNKKIIIGLLSVFLILGVVFVLGAPNAQAGIGTWVLEGFAWIAYGILWLFSKLVAVAAFLLEAVFAIEKSAGGFTKATIVTSGWAITRGLCNMIFALILLLMAFDTILQTNKFPIKTILPRLILVALTINFSLIFLGVIIDFAQILTRFFIDKAAGPNGIAAQLVNGLNITALFKTPTGALDNTKTIQAALGGGIASLLAIFGSLALGIIIILIATFALAAGAIFMLIRLVSLWVLLIFAPLAWLGMITPLPGLKSIVSDWWDKFFKWTFFAPIYAFFIYLAVLAANTPFAPETAAQKKISGSVFLNSFLSPDNGISLLLQYIVIIIILLYGLQTAQTAGLKGAGAVTAWGKKAKGALIKGTKDMTGITSLTGGIKERYGELKNKYVSAPLAKRQAEWATRFGSKSALERDMRTRAGEYEKNKSVEEMTSLAQGGDAAATYALANINVLDAPTYTAFSSKNKNEKTQKALNVKIGQKRVDLVAISNAIEKSKPTHKDYRKEYDRIEAANHGWTPSQIENQIENDSITQDIGKLSAEKFADQDWIKIESDLAQPPGSPPSPNGIQVASAAIQTYVGMTREARTEFRKRISPAQKTAINKLAETILPAGSPPLIV